MNNYIWYEKDPLLLNKEKSAIMQFYPEFECGYLDDGRFYCVGDLMPVIKISGSLWSEKNMVMAVYNNNYPEQIMGPSIRIYPIIPDLDDMEILFGRCFNISPYNNYFDFCSQASMDSSDLFYIGVWFHNRFFPNTAIHALRLHSLWMTFLDIIHVDENHSIKHFCDTHPEIMSEIRAICELIDSDNLLNGAKIQQSTE